MSDSPPLSIFFVIFEMQSSLLLSKNGTILEKYTRGQYTRVNKKENEMKCAIINDDDDDDDEAQFLFTLSSTERRNTIAKYKYSYSLHATLDKVSIPSPRFFASLALYSFLSQLSFFKRRINIEQESDGCAISIHGSIRSKVSCLRHCPRIRSIRGRRRGAEKKIAYSNRRRIKNINWKTADVIGGSVSLLWHSVGVQPVLVARCRCTRCSPIAFYQNLYCSKG